MNRKQRRLVAKKGNTMALSRYLTRWIDVPHEPGERFQFRMPNWTIIEEARAERRRKLYTVMRETREVVGAELLAEWRKEQAETTAADEATEESTALVKPKTAEEVLNEYDELLLLKAGIAAWTYCEPELDADGNPRFDTDGKPVPDRSKPIPVTTDTIRDIDPNTQKWAGLTLVALISSGFRPVMPEVHLNGHGDVIDVAPGEDGDPLAPSFSSDGILTASRA